MLLSSIGLAADGPQTGMIKGRLLNQTIAGKGVARLEIKLHQFMENKETIIGQAKTDAAGSFSFQQIKADKSAVYAVSARYGEISYFGEPIHLKDKEISQTKLIIYDTTDQATGLHVQMHHIFFEKGEDALQVEEVIVVENPGNRTFIGSREIVPGKKETFRISLPAEAKDVHYEPPLDLVSGEPGAAISVSTPLKPGKNELIYGYTIPSPGKKYVFSKVFYLNTDAVSVVLPVSKDLRVSSDRLVSKTPTAAAAGKAFNQFFGKDFAEGARLTMEISFSKYIDYFKWIIVALMLLILGTGLAIALLKKKQGAVNEDSDYS